MAKLPDGWVFIPRMKGAVKGAVTIELEQRELVTCRNCKHYKYYGLQSETVSECELMHTENPAEDWWCADGEKADD